MVVGVVIVLRLGTRPHDVGFVVRDGTLTPIGPGHDGHQFLEEEEAGKAAVPSVLGSYEPETCAFIVVNPLDSFTDFHRDKTTLGFRDQDIKVPTPQRFPTAWATLVFLLFVAKVEGALPLVGLLRLYDFFYLTLAARLAFGGPARGLPLGRQTR